MKRKCQFCGAEVEIAEEMLGDSKIDCPECGHYIMAEIEAQALLHAEKIGVYEYDINEDGWMEYWSLYSDGFYFIRYNLNDGTEQRNGVIPWNGGPVPAFLIGENGGTLYNYFVG